MINNKSYEQGTRQYLESTVGNIEDANLADVIIGALEDFEVKYLLIEQPVNAKNNLGTTKVSEFSIYGNSN